MVDHPVCHALTQAFNVHRLLLLGLLLTAHQVVLLLASRPHIVAVICASGVCDGFPLRNGLLWLVAVTADPAIVFEEFAHRTQIILRM